MFCEEITNIDSINLQESNGVNLLDNLGNEMQSREFDSCKRCKKYFHDDLLPDNVETVSKAWNMEGYCWDCEKKIEKANQEEKNSRWEDTTLSAADRCK